MTNSADVIKAKITVSRQEQEIVIQLKYLRAVISGEGSKPKVPAKSCASNMSNGKTYAHIDR